MELEDQLRRRPLSKHRSTEMQYINQKLDVKDAEGAHWRRGNDAEATVFSLIFRAKKIYNKTKHNSIGTIMTLYPTASEGMNSSRGDDHYGR